MILARLYAMGFTHLAHGPMPADLARPNGAAAVSRSLHYLMEKAPSSLDQAIPTTEKIAAFNLTVLSHIIGTPWQPDLTDHVLCVEDVGEHHYRIDRAFFTVFSNENVRRCAGLRLGRFSDIPENDIDFDQTVDEIAKYWCDRYGVAFLGHVDIGHDADNKVVPFGQKTN